MPFADSCDIVPDQLSEILSKNLKDGLHEDNRCGIDRKKLDDRLPEEATANTLGCPFGMVSDARQLGLK